jgi:hypothetical protein
MVLFKLNGSCPPRCIAVLEAHRILHCTVLQLANGYTTLPIFSQPDLLAYRSLVNAVLG